MRIERAEDLVIGDDYRIVAGDDDITLDFQATLTRKERTITGAVITHWSNGVEFYANLTRYGERIRWWAEAVTFPIEVTL